MKEALLNHFQNHIRQKIKIHTLYKKHWANPVKHCKAKSRWPDMTRLAQAPQDSKGAIHISLLDISKQCAVCKLAVSVPSLIHWHLIRDTWVWVIHNVWQYSSHPSSFSKADRFSQKIIHTNFQPTISKLSSTTGNWSLWKNCRLCSLPYQCHPRQITGPMQNPLSYRSLDPRHIHSGPDDWKEKGFDPQPMTQSCEDKETDWKRLPSLAEKSNSALILGFGLITVTLQLPPIVTGCTVLPKLQYGQPGTGHLLGNSYCQCFLLEQSVKHRGERQWRSWTENINEHWKGEDKDCNIFLKH